MSRVGSRRQRATAAAAVDAPEDLPLPPPHHHAPGSTVATCDNAGCRQAAARARAWREAENAAAPPMIVPFLELAVSVCVDRWVAEGKTLAQVLELGRAGGDALECAAGESLMQASLGDRSQKPGRITEAFSVLTRTLAAGSFMPGGVRYGGITWESDARRLRQENLEVAPAQEATP